MSRPLDFFKYRRGSLYVDGVSLSEIATRVGTPAYVYSAKGFLTPLRELRAGLKDVDHLICFAAKSCSNISILKLLNKEGAGLDLVSGGELFRAKRAGVPAEKVLFSGVGKTRDELASALRYGSRGIYSINVESVEELHALQEVARSLSVRARVALRFNPDVNPKTHPYISTGLKKNKFGMTRSEVLHVAAHAEKLPNVRICGISSHIGSQLLSLAPLSDAFARVAQVIREIEPRLREPLEFVDLGGGLGIAYKDETPPSIKDYCKTILKHFGPGSPIARDRNKPLRILLEPGRALSGNAGVLLTQALYRKHRPGKDFLIVDAAMNDLLRPALYGSHHEVVPLDQKKGRGTRVKTDVVGPVCESGDCLASGRAISKQIQAGDHLAILSAGAYGFSMSSTYNSRPRPAEVLVQDGDFTIIRERETYKDLIRGEHELD